MTFSDPGGIPYHFFERLMRDTLVTGGVIGDGYDLARTDFMDITMFWIPAYHYNLFGDPALRQYGRLTGIEESDNWDVKTGKWKLTCSPNPFHHLTEIQLVGDWGSGRLGDGEIRIYDISGRMVRRLAIPNSEFPIPSYEWDGKDDAGNHVTAGVYFLKVKSGERTAVKKLSLIR
jgi:hypothetical protein